MKKLAIIMLLISISITSIFAEEWILGGKLPDPINRLLNDYPKSAVAVGADEFDVIALGYLGNLIKCHRDANDNWTMLGGITTSESLRDLDVNKYKTDEGIGIREATKKPCYINSSNAWFHWEVGNEISGWPEIIDLTVQYNQNGDPVGIWGVTTDEEVMYDSTPFGNPELVSGIARNVGSVSISLNGDSALIHSNMDIYEYDVNGSTFSSEREVPLFPGEPLEFPIYMESPQKKRMLFVRWDVWSADIWEAFWQDDTNIKSASVGEIKAMFK